MTRDKRYNPFAHRPRRPKSPANRAQWSFRPIANDLPRIVSASYRTDVPAFYGDWFMARLAAGSCRVANPYGGPDYCVDLRPSRIAGLVFWTKNLAPFETSLDEIARRGHPFAVQYTINGYPRPLEPSVVRPDVAIDQMRRIAARYGVRAGVWRYDPVVVSSLTPPDWHLANFARLADGLRGATDEVVVSFVHPYRKTRRNLDAAAVRHGFAWHDPDADEKRALLRRLAAIAADHGMRTTLCAQPDLLTDGMDGAACIDAGRLSDIAGRRVTAPLKGNRPGCGCAGSRDVGAYDSCPHGCVYCYAVASHDRAAQRFRAHDPAAPALAARAD